MQSAMDAHGHSDGFLPHGFCYLWNPQLLSMHVVSDALIGLSYIAISGLLTYFVYRARREVPFSWMFVAFGIFIVACGATHLVEILTLWRPVYWFAAWLKIVTAVASVATAVLLPQVVRTAIGLLREAKHAEARRVQLAASEEANAAKSRFMAVMSHELRTPINAIVGYADLIEAEVAGPVQPTQRDFLARLRTSAGNLLGLVDQVLDFERVTAGKDVLIPERVHVGPLVRDAVALIEPAARARGLRVRVETAADSWIRTDAAKLRQILLNLLSNAVKYTPRGEIVVRATGGDGELLLRVQDTGIGIAPEDRERIFDPFWQADQRLTREVGGAGLGLSIVRRYVQLLGGAVVVESEPGRGTTFTVTIPPLAADAPAVTRSRATAAMPSLGTA